MTFNFKTNISIDLNDLKRIPPTVGVIFFEFVLYCKTHALPCNIIYIGNDLLIEGKTYWKDDEFHRHRVMYHLNNKFGKLGYNGKVIKWIDSKKPCFAIEVRENIKWSDLTHKEN